MIVQRPFLALGLRLTSAMLLSTMVMLVKLAGERGISLVETIFWRQAIPALLLLGWLVARGKLASVRSMRMRSHVARAGAGLLGMTCTLGAPRLLPLAETTVLGFTAPIFATALAAVLLKEKVGMIRWSAILFGFCGVLFIAGPDRAAIPLPGLIVGVMAALMVAITSIQIRDLGRSEKPIAVVFWFSAFSTAVVAPAMPFVATAHDLAGWAMLGGIGVAGLFGQLALTASLRLGSVSSVIVMDYSNLAWATLWGWLVFSQLPPASTWAGAPLIIAAGLVIVWREHRLRLEKPVVAGA